MGNLKTINENEIYSEDLKTTVHKKSLVTPFFFVPITEDKGKIAYDCVEPYGTFIDSYLPDYVNYLNEGENKSYGAYMNRLKCDVSYCIDMSLTNFHIVMQNGLFNILNQFSKVGNVYDAYIRELGPIDPYDLKNNLSNILVNLIGQKDIDVRPIISETISYFGNYFSGFLYSIINHLVFTDKLDVDRMFDYFNEISGINVNKDTIAGINILSAKGTMKYSLVTQFLLEFATADLNAFYDLLTPSVLGVVRKIKSY